MSAPSQFKRDRDREWYARNRERHIANVIARRKGTVPNLQLPIGEEMEFDHRIAYACAVIRFRHPRLWDRARDDARQVASIAAIENQGRLALRRATQREAYKLEHEIGFHEKERFAC